MEKGFVMGLVCFSWAIRKMRRRAITLMKKKAREGGKRFDLCMVHYLLTILLPFPLASPIPLVLIYAP